MLKDSIEFSFFVRANDFSELTERVALSFRGVDEILVDNLMDHSEDEIFRFYSDVEKKFVNVVQEHFFEFRELIAAYYDGLNKVKKAI